MSGVWLRVRRPCSFQSRRIRFERVGGPPRATGRSQPELRYAPLGGTTSRRRDPAPFGNDGAGCARESEVATACLGSSLVTKSNDGVHAHGAACRDSSGGEHDDEREGGGKRVDQRVRGADVYKCGAQDAG